MKLFQLPLKKLKNIYLRFLNKIELYIKKIRFAHNIKFTKRNKLYLIGTPEHINLGDSAIVLAETFFLKNNFVEEQIIEITYNEYRNYRKSIKKIIKKNELICLLGGGNMGDEWLHEENLRRQILQDFPNNKTIIFPQTIFYSNTERGILEKEKSKPIYNNHKNLILVAREKKSYEIMKELYPNINILLTPDIVLSSTKELYEVEQMNRTDVLLCMRSDAEKELSQEDCDKIENIILQKIGSFRRTDMYSDISVTKNNRKECVQKKMQEFASAKLVVTDRLHGMVFAAITETPCIVFSNYNQKVSGTYEWIQDLSYIKFVNSVDEMKDALNDLMNINEARYDNLKWIREFLPLENALNSNLKNKGN